MATNRQYILNIIEPTTLDSANVVYNIQNPKSNFVVITYWWGRNKGNRNLHRPCLPEPLPEGTELTTFGEMIEGHDGWLETCHKAGVNYMAVEYNKFVEDKKYQLAINAKPYFIKKALELCGDRAVVYIDGDMTINRYPAIFDITDVDFMGRNWNCDPRGKYDYEENPGADFYTFETSGGTMYFGQTPQAHRLLDAWIQTTELSEMKGKADDRILSLIFNNTNMYLPINFIQLPIEYLWLSMYYDEYVERETMTIQRNGKNILREPRDYIFIEHPHCLTTEDVAISQSGQETSSRHPNTYNRNVTKRVGEREGGWFHDYIFFDSEEQADGFLPYLHYADNHTFRIEKYYNNTENMNVIDEVPIFYHEHWAARYGSKFNKIVAENQNTVARINKRLSYKSPSRTTDCPAGDAALSGPCKVIRGGSELIPQILYYLQQRIDVLYVPPGASAAHIQEVIEEAERGNNQFITVNRSQTHNNNNYTLAGRKREYRLEIPASAPIYFGSRSKILQHLLLMCRGIRDLSRTFNSSFVFLTRIRCHWVDEPMPDIASALINPESEAELEIAVQAIPKIYIQAENIKANNIPQNRRANLPTVLSRVTLGGRRRPRRRTVKRRKT